MTHSRRSEQRSSGIPVTPSSDYDFRNRNDEVNLQSDTKIYSARPKRLRFSIHDGGPDSIDDEDYSGYEVLVGQTWKVFRVSPLHNFEYSRIRMKQYSRRMREHLTVTMTDSTKEAHYDVIFSVAEEISRAHNRAVQILVNLITRKNGEDFTSKFYRGYLLCRDTQNEEASVHLPMLLCNGSLRAINSVHFLLEKFFDCCISPFQLTQDEFMWICAILPEEKDMYREDHKISMVFSFPQISIKNSVDFKIPFRNLKVLWESIHEEDSEYITYEEVKRFQHALLHQLATIFEFNLACGHLKHIKTPSFSITTEIKFKTWTDEMMCKILRILYDMSTLIDTPAPTMNAQAD